jgi:chemotaxis-related protein WspB
MQQMDGVCMSMLLFYVGKSGYAIDSFHVLRIIPLVDLKKMTAMPHYIAGFLNFGGKVVAVVDFCQLIEERPAHFRIIN